jgi:hypothetical protein
MQTQVSDNAKHTPLLQLIYTTAVRLYIVLTVETVYYRSSWYSITVLLVALPVLVLAVAVLLVL